MGARGLLKFLRTNPQSRGRFFSLSRLRVNASGSEAEKQAVIVCDFFAVVFWLLGWFHEAKVKSKDYPQHTYVYGADYDDYSDRIVSFVKALRYGGAEPVFFVDGPKGCTQEQLQLKLMTWLTRQSHTDSLIDRFGKYCAYHPTQSMIVPEWTMKCLLRLQIVRALQKCGAEVIICNGEADRPMAEYAREHPEVCGILTNDTDITMMASCSTLHCKFFDRDDGMKLRSPEMNEKPYDILCEKIEPARLAECLKIDVQCLPALSILLGNDYTTYYNQQKDVTDIFKFTYPFVESAACWIRGRRCNTVEAFLSNAEIRRICKLYPDYHNAVKHTFSFYRDSEQDMDTPDPRSPLGSLLIPLIFLGKLSEELLPIINCGVYWRTPIQQFDRATCVHSKMLPVRRSVYSLLSLDRVSEYGQFVMDELRIVVIPLPPTLLPQIRDTLTQQQRMLAMYAILTQDPDFDREPKRLYSAIVSVKVWEQPSFHFSSLLIYACLVAAAKTEVVEADCLEPLIVTCLCASIGERSRRLTLRPDCRAVTCGSQFTSVLEHAYILSSLFNLHDELPLPSDVFRVPAYVAFHMVGLGSGRCRGPDGELQAFYWSLVGALSVDPLKKMVTCGGVRGIAPFCETFASSQATLREFLHPSNPPDAKAKLKPGPKSGKKKSRK